MAQYGTICHNHCVLVLSHSSKMSIGHLPRSHSASRDLPCQQLKQQLPADVLQSPMASQPTGSSDETRYKLLGCRPSSLGWRPSLLGWRPSLYIMLYYVILGWRPSLSGWRPSFSLCWLHFDPNPAQLTGTSSMPPPCMRAQSVSVSLSLSLSAGSSWLWRNGGACKMYNVTILYNQSYTRGGGCKM